MELADPKYDVFNIPIHQIWADQDFNCRKNITRHSIEELSQSIDKDGLIFPVDVQPAGEAKETPEGFTYSLVCGFRRLMAVKLLGWKNVPGRLREGLTERQAQVMNLTENLERKDLNTYEEALAIDKLFEPYRTVKSIALELKRPEHWVSVRRYLMILSPFIQKAVVSGRLTDRDLRLIQSAIDPDEKAKELLRAPKGQKSRIIYNGKHPRKKTEVKALITKMLDEGFNPQLLRLLGWAIGEVNDEELTSALGWLRDKKGWLR